MIRTANPALNAKSFGNFDLTRAAPRNVMTLQGAVNKTTILLVLLIAAAALVWHRIAQAAVGLPDPQAALGAMASAAQPWLWGGLIVGLILALVTIFAPKVSPFTAPLYALAEGAFIGAISVVVDVQFPDTPLAAQAAGCTFGVLAIMLVLYTTRILRPTRKFVFGVVAATGGVFLFYLVSILLGFFGVNVGFLHDSSPLSIGISGVIVVIAALNLILDFGFIEDQAARGAPKYMEWYAAFGLLVTLVWLYLEILRLLAKLQRR